MKRTYLNKPSKYSSTHVKRAQSPHASGVRLVTHPLDEPGPVLADVSLRAGCEGSYAGWSGEEVVWSSRTLPFVATYSEVRTDVQIMRLCLRLCHCECVCFCARGMCACTCVLLCHMHRIQ
jgi:hypothetical protein